MINKIKSSQNAKLLISSFVIMLISPLLMNSNVAFIAFLGLFFFVIGICLFCKQVLCFIDGFATKTKKRSIITYGILGVFFTFIFISQFCLNTPDLIEKLSDSYSMNKYIIGTITEKTETTMTIIGNVNNKEEVFIVDQSVGEINEEITVFFNPDNLKVCSIISPTFFNMLYFFAYAVAVGVPFLFCFTFDKRFYRLFKPKKIKEVEPEIKVKK